MQIADLLGCSLDYLLCRTDNPSGFAVGIPAEQQKAGLCEFSWYPAAHFPDDKQDLVVIDKEGWATDGTFENGRLTGAGLNWDEILFWTPAPDPDGVVRSVPQPTGQLMIAGWMPGGTTPAEPCDVVADFDADGVTLRRLAYWDGTVFLFGEGKAAIDAACIKWMRLPPDEEAE